MNHNGMNFDSNSAAFIAIQNMLQPSPNGPPPPGWVVVTILLIGLAVGLWLYAS